MQAWRSLLRKECRIGVPAFWIVLGALLFIGGVTAFIGERHGYFIETLLIFSTSALIGMTLYLSFYFIVSFTSDTKRLHLWLHHPGSGLRLLLAKLTSGVIYQFITMDLLLLVILITAPQSQAEVTQAGWDFWFSMVMIISIHILLLSISMSVGIIFFWMIFLLMKNSMSTILSVCLTVVTAIVLLTVFGWFTESSFYAMITQWGEIDVTGVLFWLDQQLQQYAEIPDVYAGAYLFNVLFTIGLFLLSVWILDRKVEV
ncbi:hypothetical protein [Salibacterium sp. K-3]